MYTIKMYLNDFWDEFGGSKKASTRKTKSEVLEILKKYGYFFPLKSATPYSVMRARMQFNKVKYGRHNLKTHETCFACKEVAEVRHHIIPLKSGGHNGKRNLVSLCKPCHAEIHPWLKSSCG